MPNGPFHGLSARIVGANPTFGVYFKISVGKLIAVPIFWYSVDPSMGF